MNLLPRTERRWRLWQYQMHQQTLSGAFDIVHLFVVIIVDICPHKNISMLNIVKSCPKPHHFSRFLCPFPPFSQFFEKKSRKNFAVNIKVPTFALAFGNGWLFPPVRRSSLTGCEHLDMRRRACGAVAGTHDNHISLRDTIEQESLAGQTRPFGRTHIIDIIQ